jgi:hypothetical protein
MAEDELPKGAANVEPEDEVEAHIPKLGRPGANVEPDDEAEVEGHSIRNA